MINLNSIAIAMALLGLGYGSSFAQSISDSTTPAAATQLSDEAYLALANSEAFDMFGDSPAPLTASRSENVLILGLDEVSSSLYCAADILDKLAQEIDTDETGILFVETSDIAPYLDSDNCFVNDAVITLSLAAGS